jgi:hypothetical protein
MKLLKILFAAGAFALAAMLVPRLLAEIAAAESAYGYGRVTGALSVVALAAAAGLGFLRSAFSEDLLRDDKPRSGFGTVVMFLLVFAAVGGAVFLRSKVPLPTLDKLPLLAEMNGASQTPGSQIMFASVQDAQKEAVRRFPQVGVNGSAANKAYVSRYRKYQQERPEYFKSQDWPLRLAEEVSALR